MMAIRNNLCLSLLTHSDDALRASEQTSRTYDPAHLGRCGLSGLCRVE